MRLKSVLLIGGIVAILFLGGFAYYVLGSTPATEPVHNQTLTIDGNAIRVTLAQTDAERERGLGGRTGLASDEGMLFVFPKDGLYQFWMKDMQFSIDILWIDARGKIIYIQPNVAPETYPQAFGPKVPARYVLELPANYAKSRNIAAGDTVEFGLK